ncbi:MAG TPA: glycosyltransferase family 1 protein [Verrucomicrobiae bacterium]|jgi:glycosyltransferase involved in cell wall biosynthesis|nr:glycosyltransferase family 1 protein [Verrucomicrobiae bacterium]
MRIGISTSVVQRGKTGIAQYLFALLRAFLPYANENRFVLFVLEEDLPLFDFAKSFMQVVPVSEQFRPPIKNILWHQTVLPRLARSLQLDVLHVPSYRRMLWPRPCPLVATIHDLAPFRIPKKYSWARMFYGRVIARRLARRQDAIIAISENTAQDIREFFDVRPGRVRVIHNGLEHDRFFPGSREQAQAEMAGRHQLRKPFFLYVARLEHPAKNHVRLISAFNEFKAATRSDWQLVFGGSDWHGAEAIHAAARLSPFAPDIRFLGFVADEELPDLYRAADAFVYPSLYEGFGMPPIEAMACGCPVICSTRGSLGEVVGEAAAIVEPEEIPSITRQLVTLAGEPRVRERLRDAGLAQSKKFDWNRTAAETLSLYAGLARNAERFSPMLR